MHENSHSELKHSTQKCGTTIQIVQLDTLSYHTLAVAYMYSLIGHQQQ